MTSARAPSLTRPLWLVGGDIARSPSPAMHNAALAAMGLPALYEPRPCTAEALMATLDEAERTCRGINVTAPHKARVAERYQDVLDDDARAAGAVNTVVFEGGRAVRASNTDVAGLAFAWHRTNLHVEGRTIALLGAGGAARAVVVAAHQARAAGVIVHARRMSAAVALVNVAAGLGLDAIALGEPAGAAPAGANSARLLVVAASALDDAGVWLARSLGGPGAVHDLRYGAAARPMRDAALAGGHLFSDGTLMLLAQGQHALAQFVGAPLPDVAVAAMRRALLASLAGA